VLNAGPSEALLHDGQRVLGSVAAALAVHAGGDVAGSALQAAPQGRGAARAVLDAQASQADFVRRHRPTVPPASLAKSRIKSGQPQPAGSASERPAASQQHTPRSELRARRAVPAGTLWLAACLILALGIYLSPFIPGIGRPTAATGAEGSGASGYRPLPAYSAFTPPRSGARNSGSVRTLARTVAGLLPFANGSEPDAPALATDDPDPYASLAAWEDTPADLATLARASNWDGLSASSPYVYQNIERLRPGDLVVATDPATRETRLARVAQTYERVTYHLRHLVLQDAAGNTQHIETTDEHPFLLVGINDFVPADRLRVGDNLRGPLGEALFVIETRYERHPEGIAVFNLEVEDLHTYYIAAHGARAPPAWVHNACPYLKPAWGRNRAIKELHARGFRLKEPAKGRGLIYYHPQTLEEIRIMERPARAPFRGEPAEKFLRPYYYRYRTGIDQPWGPHTPLPGS
jgi:hypothetical protein